MNSEISGSYDARASVATSLKIAAWVGEPEGAGVPLKAAGVAVDHEPAVDDQGGGWMGL